MSTTDERRKVTADEAVAYLLDRIGRDEKLRYLMIGTEAYARLVTAFAYVHGAEELLPEMPSLVDPLEFGKQVMAFKDALRGTGQGQPTAAADGYTADTKRTERRRWEGQPKPSGQSSSHNSPVS